ncbi:EAL domain-containing protein [Brucella intermedia]|uniref:EAL domain-containing protein n=1 Tax=Brucella intermedia TaxID=94625 RepID=UPI002362BF9C|nr:EAL domain-containing protein [Brucella intermedia]
MAEQYVPSRRWRIIAFGIAMAVVAALIPIIAMTWVSYNAALHKEQERLAAVADRAVGRAISTFEEVHRTLDTIRGHMLEPCSPAHIAVMRDQTVNTMSVEEIGYFENGTLKCSSWGKADTEITQSVPDFTTPDGLEIILRVKPRASLSREFSAIKLGNYNALILPASFLDIALDDEMAVYLSKKDKQIIAKRDDSNLFGADAAITDASQLAASSFLVGVADREGLRAVVIVPRSKLGFLIWDEMLVFLPVGVLIAIALVSAVYWFSRRRLSPQAELELAVRNREFIVHYQPIIELSTGVCVGAEALVRWKMPDGTFVRPDLFIPVAEETGLIAPITDQVIDTVIRDLKGALNNDRTLHIAINVSASDIETGRIIDVLDRKLRNTGVRKEQIWLEATERGFMDIETAGGTLDRARQAGHSVAIDDFGTGYSNLQYLQGLPLDAIKIDKSFVQMIGRQTATSSVIELIIELTKKLDSVSVAEGVETEEQATFLTARGVTYAQGWLFSKPLGGKEFIAYQTDRKRMFGSAFEVLPTRNKRKLPFECASLKENGVAQTKS